MKIKSLLLALLAITLASSLFSQSKAWSILDVNDGLSSNRVLSAYIENDSSWWIGTSNGLCYYDGKLVSTYFIGGLSLAQQNIHEIEATGDTIWLRTNLGITSYDGINFVNYDTTNGLLSNDIKDISADSKGNLWIGSTAGISRFDGTNFFHYPTIKASVLGVDSADRVYAINPPFLLPTVSTLKIYNGNKWDTIPPSPNIPLAGTQRLFKSVDNRLLAETGTQVFYEFNYPFNPIPKTISLSQNNLPSALEVNQNKIWAGINHLGPSLCFTEDSIMEFYNAGITNVNFIELAEGKLFVGTENGLAYATETARPLKLNASYGLNDIGIKVSANRGVFEDDFPSLGFEVPKGSKFGAIFSSDFITVAKKGGWYHNPGYYNQGIQAGPLNSNQLGFEWPYLVKVSQSEINLHKSSYSQSGYQMPEGIKNWPAVGDSTLSIATDLAPFKDVNQNGCYDPENGDYPLIKGEEALYWIRHSTDPNLQFEYHYMLYGFNNSSNQDLNRSLFLDFRIINREPNRIDSIKTGYFVDWDLGNGADDYVGCDSLNNTFYVYNGDSLDHRLVNGNLVSEANIPFVGVRFLSDSMATFMPVNFQGGQPPLNFSIHYFNLLNSRWANGQKLTYGGNGFNQSSGIPTNYMHTGNPLTQSGWTAANPGYGVSNTIPGDRRGIASIPYYSLNAGESKTITVALGFGRKDSVQSHLENYPEMQRVLASAKAVYDTISPRNPDYGSNYSCTLVSLPEESKKQTVGLKVYPNPSNGQLSVEASSKIREVQVINLKGQLLRRASLNHFKTSFDLTDLKQGVYLLRVKTHEGKWESHKLLLNR